MKKNFTVIALILAILILFASCGKKTVMTADLFKTNIEALGFEAIDVTSTFSSSDDCEKVYKAIPEDDKYTIYFYQFSSPAAAMNEYMYLVKNYSAGEETSGNNYNRMIYQNAGTYVLISRVDNTIFCLNTPLLYSEDAIAVVNQFEY